MVGSGQSFDAQLAPIHSSDSPVFASAAAGLDMTHPITVEGQPLSFVRLTLTNTSSVIGMEIGELETQCDISVVLLCRGKHQDFHPPRSERLQAEDVLGDLGSPDQISNWRKTR